MFTVTLMMLPGSYQLPGFFCAPLQSERVNMIEYEVDCEKGNETQ